MDSYQKVLDNPVAMPTWISVTNGHTFFQQTERGSITFRLWETHKRRCWSKNHRDCLMKLSASTVIESVKNMSRQEVVIIASDYFASLIHAALCPLADTMNLNPVVLRRDKLQRPKFLFALTYSRFMDQSLPVVAAAVTERGFRTLESGIIPNLFKPTTSPISHIASSESVRKCLNQDHGPKDHPLQIPSEGFSDFKLLFGICGFFLFISLFAHLVTLFKFKLINVRNIRNRKEQQTITELACHPVARVIICRN